jgi:hypothetical protein
MDDEKLNDIAKIVIILTIILTGVFGLILLILGISIPLSLTMPGSTIPIVLFLPLAQIPILYVSWYWPRAGGFLTFSLGLLLLFHALHQEASPIIVVPLVILWSLYAAGGLLFLFFGIRASRRPEIEN